MRLKSLALLAGLAGFTATGCYKNRVEEGMLAEETATVRVENDNVSSMRVSVVRAPSGTEYRLGTATGMTSTDFQIPRSLLNGVSELTFEITPLSGGQARFSRTITISPGEELILRIPPI